MGREVIGSAFTGLDPLHSKASMQMSTRIICGIIFFGAAMTGGFVANMLTTAMIGEINRKRQNGNTLSYFGFTPSKTLRILREYRSSYPEGRLHIYWLMAVAIAAASMIVVAVSLRILG
jgi:hypothetical protein